jgi:hypothetical protein
MKRTVKTVSSAPADSFSAGRFGGLFDGEVPLRRFDDSILLSAWAAWLSWFSLVVVSLSLNLPDWALIADLRRRPCTYWGLPAHGLGVHEDLVA